MRAYFSFLDEEYSITEKLIFQLSEEYSSNHWIKRIYFIVRCICQTGNNYQAKLSK